MKLKCQTTHGLFFDKFSAKTKLDRFFLSYDRLRIDQAFGRIIRNVSLAEEKGEISADILDQIDLLYFSQVEKKKNQFAIECLKNVSLAFDDEDHLGSLQAHVAADPSNPPSAAFVLSRTLAVASAAEMLTLLNSFPDGSLQARVCQQINDRLEKARSEDLSRIEKWGLISSVARHAARVAANGIDPESRAKVDIYTRASEDVSNLLFSGQARLDFIIPVPNNFMLSIENDGSYDHTGGIGSLGMNPAYFKDTMYVNTSLDQVNLDSDQTKSYATCSRTRRSIALRTLVIFLAAPQYTIQKLAFSNQ